MSIWLDKYNNKKQQIVLDNLKLPTLFDIDP